MSLIGAEVLRKEDPDLLTGRAQFVDDISIGRAAAMVFVRSTEAHALILGIDTAAAATQPGVLRVWTASDVEDLPPCPGLPGLERPLLARDVVRFVGEPVAVVLAESAAAAVDAAETVVVDYDPLPVAATLAHALADDAPALHEVLGGNVVFDQPFADSLDDEFASAPMTASLHIVNNRCVAVPIEPNSCLADWQPSGGLTLWATFQAPHHLRSKIAQFFGLAQDATRVIVPDVGGGFGAKINFVPEFFLAPALSRAVGRPVKYTQTRSEAMLLMYHGRAQEQDIEVAFDADATIRALRVRVTQDQGAYPDPTGMGLPVLTTAMAAGCYAIPKVAVSWRNVTTNTTPVAAYRGAGRPEASFLIERTIDVVADVTGVDPVEVRRRNFIAADAFPYASHSPLAVYDSGNYPAAVDALLELLDYDELKAEQARRRDDTNAKLLGIGFSTWLEIAGFGPPGSLEGFGHLGSWESVQVRVQPDGSAIIYTGASPHGQGTDTTFAQIASDHLGISFDKISVRHGDTATIPQGIGTMGSRITSVGGEGVKTASSRVADRAKGIAAHLLEANPDDIVFAEDGFAVAGTPARTVAWSEVATKSFQPLELPEDYEPGSLDETVLQQVPNFSFPSGAYCCVVEIDRETGDISIAGMYLVDDCGTVINPLLAEGQVHGGVTQGIAQALYEGVVYDDAGTPLNASLIDYLVPSAVEIPNFVSGRTNTPTPNNTLGAKGIGESGSVGAPPAVVNAVVDALSHLGVTHIDMPISPMKVWDLLRSEA